LFDISQSGIYLAVEFPVTWYKNKLEFLELQKIFLLDFQFDIVWQITGGHPREKNITFWKFHF